jgi:putative FmdB family regulatory protein
MVIREIMMPTYEFTCKKCKKNFEIFTSISQKTQVTCPECGGKDIQEVFGAFFVGGNVSKKGAGQDSNCDGTCGTCGSSCG